MKLNTKKMISNVIEKRRKYALFRKCAHISYKINSGITHKSKGGW